MSHPYAAQPPSAASGSSGSLGPSPMPRGSLTGPRQSSVGSGSSSAGRPGPTLLDSNITKLLVTTKQLLQGLEQWATGSISEEDVSDIYVRLGNGFEQCVTAFNRVGIATKELDSIPQDLRECLERALAEDPSQETLNICLPEIRAIIFNLLNGLKQKQAQWKRIATSSPTGSFDHPHPAPAAPSRPAPAPAPGASPATAMSPALPLPAPIAMRAESSGDRLSARSASSAASDRSISPSPAVGANGLPPKVPSSSALAERGQRNPSQPTRPAPPDAFRPPRRAGESSNRTVSPQPPPAPSLPPLPNSTGSDGSSFAASAVAAPRGVQLQDTGPVPSSSSSGSVSGRPNRPERFSRDSIRNQPVSRFSADSDITNGSPITSPPSRTLARSPPKSISTVEEGDVAPSIPTGPSLPTIQFPTSLSMENTAVPSPPLPAPPLEVPPESRATLAALQRTGDLERRASKRFSSYTFNKMLPGSSPAKKGNSSSPQRPARRADRPPPMPALPERSPNLEEEELEGLPPARTGLVAEGIEGLERSASPMSDGSSSSVRIVRTPDSLRPLDRPRAAESEDGGVSAEVTPRPPRRSSTAAAEAQDGRDGGLGVFLQVGKQVKKVTLELPVTLSDLRLMFMEKFEYDPGMEDFPDVYMRDNRTGITFEVEDMEDLVEGSLLSLNIEPLDQVKQHFDHTFASLMAELKEMKTALDHSRRISMHASPSHLTVSPSTSLRRPASPSAVKSEPRSPSPRLGSIVPAERAAELQKQSDELSLLRRDLAVMRQVHVDFLQETKDAFGKLRGQNNQMREVVKTKMGGSRAILDNSKAKLDKQCQDTIQSVEEISDIIDGARIDAYKRFVTPSKTQMATIKSDLAKATEMVESFARDVTSVDPTWRATWQLELSRVMEEQKLLSYQTKLAQDLRNDIRDATEMLSTVSDFVEQRAASGATGAPGRGFRPPSPDEASGGIPNLLMEIRTKESDPNQRLRAIEAQRKAREREKANQTDEFASELGDFVKGRKLKKTGGTDEAERMRNRRQEQTLKKMLVEGANGGEAAGTLTPQTTGASARSPPQAASGGSSRRPTPSVGIQEELKVKEDPR